MQHTLLETDSLYECQVCGRSWHKEWKTGPQNDCQGLRSYPFGDFEGLMTANQLDIMGYKADRGHLPDPVGYYWRGKSRRPRRDAGPVFLYDPSHAALKKPTTKQRLTKGVNVIAWPLIWVELLNRYADLKQEKEEVSERRNYLYADLLLHELALLSDDILRIAACLVFGMFDEEATGPCVEIAFPPVLFRRRYERPTFEEGLIVVRLVEGYKREHNNHVYHL